MDHTQYSSNSHKARAARRQTEHEKRVNAPVVSGKARVKKKSEIRKFADVFIAEDMETIKSYALTDVFVPMLKKAFVEAGVTAIEMLFLGEARPRGRRDVPAGHVSYGSYYQDPRSRIPAPPPVRAGSGYAQQAVIFESRGDAEMVLSDLRGLIETYQIARIADLKDLANIVPITTDWNYGWTDLQHAYVDREYDGYVIRLPKAMPIE